MKKTLLVPIISAVAFFAPASIVLAKTPCDAQAKPACAAGDSAVCGPAGGWKWSCQKMVPAVQAQSRPVQDAVVGNPPENTHDSVGAAPTNNIQMKNNGLLNGLGNFLKSIFDMLAGLFG